ncbi:hypothetical protein ACFOEK_21235, partial [Litoribrevibacter euphylliae]
EVPTDVDEHLDFDKDGIGDGKDPDDDNDGLTDAFEESYEGFDKWAYNDPDHDTDGDGLTDQEEQAAGSSPLLTDTDGDQIPDDYEVANGLDVNADDSQIDLDGDGYNNQWEYLIGTNPLENEFDDRTEMSVLGSLKNGDVTANGMTVDGLDYIREVIPHASGKFVYVLSSPDSSVRRIQNIVIFARDALTGELNFLSNEPLGMSVVSALFTRDGTSLYLMEDSTTPNLIHYNIDEVAGT